MHRWFVWPDEDFPRTSTQKPRSNLIRQVAQASLASGTVAAASPSALADLIKRIKGGAGPELRPEADLEADLNLSSLDRVELLESLEDRYQMDLNETGFAAVKTVGDLERMLHGQFPARVKYHYPAWAQRWPTTWNRLILQYLLLRPAILLVGLAAYRRTGKPAWSSRPSPRDLQPH